MAIRHVEEWINARDNTPIYTKTWKSAIEPPIATVVFVHGYGEHINRYDHVFDKFSAVGIEVYGYDQRGFGRTAQRNNNQGVTGGWDVLMSDITAALISKRRKGIPQFLYGHSMGGALALNYACNGPEQGNVAGYLATSPLLELAPESSKWPIVVLLGRLAAKILPSFVLSMNLDASWMSHDDKEVAKYKADPFIKPFGSLQCLSDMTARPLELFRGSYKNITRPVFIAHGTGDKVTSHKASDRFFLLIPQHETSAYKHTEWKGLFHELHNEKERDQVIQEYIDWILGRARK